MSICIGNTGIDFNANAVDSDGKIIYDFNLKNYRNDSYCVLFFYPLDFTFVCPTEIISFSNKIQEFNNCNTKVVGVSIDSHFVHAKWRNTPISEGGIGEINYPLVSDITKQIAQDYGVLFNNSVALRATFILDKNFILRHISVNDLPLGRNVDEVLRLIDALQFHEEKGDVCPAGWKKGCEGMQPSQEGMVDYLTSHAEEL